MICWTPSNQALRDGYDPSQPLKNALIEWVEPIGLKNWKKVTVKIQVSREKVFQISFQKKCRSCMNRDEERRNKTECSNNYTSTPS